MRRVLRSSKPTPNAIRARASRKLHHGLAVLVSLGLSACSSAQVAADVTAAKSVIHSATTDLQAAIAAYQADPTAISNVVTAAQKLSAQLGVGQAAVAEVTQAVSMLQQHAGTVEQVQTALAKVSALTVPPAAPATGP
jgi:hypothetical protein